MYEMKWDVLVLHWITLVFITVAGIFVEKYEVADWSARSLPLTQHETGQLVSVFMKQRTVAWTKSYESKWS